MPKAKAEKRGGPKVRKYFGPPGTGKTTKMLSILENLLRQGVNPKRIAFLTFTRNARAEAKERALSLHTKTTGRKLIRPSMLLKEEDLQYFRTIHSICFQQLGINKTMVVNPAALKEFGAMNGYEFSYRAQHQFDEDALFEMGGAKPGDKYLAFDHWRRHKLLDLDTAFKLWPDALPFYEVEEFVRKYTKWKDDEGLLDFTDFLQYAKFPLDVDVVIVDEAQDLSDLQWRVVWMFASQAKEVYLAGDDDQAIFTWAGASPEILIDTPGEVNVLEQSYRLPRSVWELSQRMVRKISKRQEKIFRPRDEEGSVEYLHALADVPFNTRESWKILVRNNYLKGDVKLLLKQIGIPYKDNGYFALGKKAVEAIFSWEELRKGKRIPVEEALNVYEYMTTRIGVAFGSKKKLEDARSAGLKNVNIKDLQGLYGLLTADPWFAALTRIREEDTAYVRSIVRQHGSEVLRRAVREKPAKGEVDLLDISTIHAAKGSEADNIVILCDMAPRCWRALAEDTDSEMRVWFTGVTRSKKNLYVIGTNDAFSA